VISVDTSVIVRYLVGTPPDQARRATRLVDSQESIGIPVVVLLDAAHVLRTQYGVVRADVLETLIGLVTRENVTPLGLPRDVAIEALVRARSLPGFPLPDALVAAMARVADALPLYTFDSSLSRHGVPVAAP
jgi:predicted nucleic acid-binding protein